ncbi:hypothetical protein KC960_02540 [Candidatus Saccharibacteria bacterium]|nr:hypothetical protein [Candidatus Saccharibacteria bacterium]
MEEPKIQSGGYLWLREGGNPSGMEHLLRAQVPDTDGALGGLAIGGAMGEIEQDTQASE